MSAADIAARVQRLDELARGIAREIQVVEKTDILLYVERRAYLDALRQVWVGLENAKYCYAAAILIRILGIASFRPARRPNTRGEDDGASAARTDARCDRPSHGMARVPGLTGSNGQDERLGATGALGTPVLLLPSR
jgi:hypothetical protein